MIEELIRFRCRCDGCNKELTTGQFVSEFGRGALLVNLRAQQWHKKGDKWYCPECYNNLYHE